MASTSRSARSSTCWIASGTIRTGGSSFTTSSSTSSAGRSAATLRCASDAEEAAWADVPDLDALRRRGGDDQRHRQGDRARRHGRGRRAKFTGSKLTTWIPAPQPRSRLAAADRVHEKRKPAEARARASKPPSAATRANSASPKLEWGIVGLLHDFDYERWPTAEDHPFRGCEILEAQGYPEWVRRAILSHADYSGVPRESRLEKTLFACDEMAGFVTAASLVRPSKSVLDLEASSVIKRMKDKAFARGGQARGSARRRRAAGPAARRAHRQRHRVHARTGRRPRPAGNAVGRAGDVLRHAGPFQSAAHRISI